MKENSKVRHFSKIEEIYHYCPGCQNGPKQPKTAQTVKFMFSNVVYRPTVCKTRELRWCTAVYTSTKNECELICHGYKNVYFDEIMNLLADGLSLSHVKILELLCTVLFLMCMAMQKSVRKYYEKKNPQ